MDVSPELPVDKHGTCPRCGAALGEPYDRKEYDEGETLDGRPRVDVLLRYTCPACGGACRDWE